jgi:hypothetical protein
VKTLVGLVSAGLVVAVILALYLSGPSVKASGARCRLDSSFGPLQAKVCIRKPGTDHFRYVQRTNAWERFKGAITGNP